MKNVKVLLCATLCMALMACTLLIVTVPTTAAGDRNVTISNHWRHHDGHWNYWHDGDQRWYYTDGSNWFYNNGNAWNVYGFDKQFGREGFERGDYRAPSAGAKFESPRHNYYRTPTK